MITNGQARRIAAEWQAPHNACSLLQHKGIIGEDLPDELRANMRGRYVDATDKRELAALLQWTEHHGPGQVRPWGAWDDRPAR